MEIYALFRGGVHYCAAVVQGPLTEDGSGGQYDVIGDERWKEATSNAEHLCGCHEDWVQISEDDFAKYMLGSSGGENGTGYIRDPKTGHAISAPVKVYTFDERVAQIQSKHSAAMKELEASFINASLADMDTTELKEQYAALVEQSNSDFMQLINSQK